MPFEKLMDAIPFVARERELDEMSTMLGRACNGTGQVCFVAGDAGAGKTTLITEFARRSQETHPELLFVYGTCNAQTGIGDPYLPFREVLGQLTGTIEPTLARGLVSVKNAGRLQKALINAARVLIEVGPDLIDVLVPGSKLIGKLGKSLADKSGWTDDLEAQVKRLEGKPAAVTAMDQSRIFEQYTNYLLKLSAEHPIALVLDDLQWADVASVSLLFHLVRRIEASHIMLIGAYRPSDVAFGHGSNLAPDERKRHPLEGVLEEIKRYFGDVWIDLADTSAAEGRHFIDAIIDIEPNQLGDKFREAFYQHTGGYPLFTVELLRDMKERGDLIRNAQDQWVVAGAIDWQTLPAKVEGVIEKRIRRIDAACREILGVASIEGETFTAEVVARVQNVSERSMVRNLSRDLDERHRIIAAQTTSRLGRQRLSRYRFRHNLFQQYLYHALDEVERSYLHEAVGNELESLYAGHTEDIAVQLAWHFQEAGLVDKAVNYLQTAADAAADVYAYSEAATLYRQALTLIDEWQTGEEHLRHLYSGLGRTLEITSQFDDALATYEEMAQRAQALGDRSLELAALIDQVTLFATPTPLHDPIKGWELAHQTLALARELGDQAAEAKTLWNLALGGMWSGRTREGILYAEQAVGLARELNLTELLAYALNDLGMLYVAVLDVKRAIPILTEAGTVWRRLDNLPMLTDNVAMTAMARVAAGDFDQAIKLSEDAYALSESHKNLWGQSYSRMMVCLAYWEKGNPTMALKMAHESVRVGRDAGFMAAQVMSGGYLASFFGELGALDRAQQAAQEAVGVAASHFPHFYCHPLGVLVQLHLKQGRIETAEALIRQAAADPYRTAQPCWNMRVNIAEVELALAKREFEYALELVDAWLPDLHAYELRAYLPTMLRLRGTACAGLARREDARRSLDEARHIAAITGARATLWPILVALADLVPSPDERRKLRRGARHIVTGIAGHIDSPDLRTSFLAQHQVKALFNAGDGSRPPTASGASA